MTFSLYVSPLSHVSQSLIKQTFSEFGEVVDVYIPRSYKTKKRLTYGYIKYSDKHCAARAIEALNGKDLNGHMISVAWAECNAKTPEEMMEKRRQFDIEREPREPLPIEEIERRRSKKARTEGPLHLKYFTAVDYPPGIGEKYTPVYQRNLPPVGERRHFFSWFYISPEQKERIIKEELDYQARTRNRKGGEKPNEVVDQPQQTEIPDKT